MKTILPENIDKAVHILRDGGLVAFPTETVYGLGADARNDLALQRVYKTKGRPQNHPLIVHILGAAQLADWAKEVPESALKLADAFWPGPLTMVLKKKEGVSDVLTAGYDSVAIRAPSHPAAQSLLRSFVGGLAAPSANKFTRISPTTASAVFEELGDTVDMILDGGACDVGVESTIIDLTGDVPRLLRPGMLSQQQIEAVLGMMVQVESKDEAKSHAPGSHVQHYAPKTPTQLIQTEQIARYIQKLQADDLPLVCMAHSHEYFPQVKQVEWVNMPDQPEEYAHELYRTLRALDSEEYKRILIEAVPETDDWLAIRDRLSRAADKLS